MQVDSLGSFMEGAHSRDFIGCFIPVKQGVKPISVNIRNLT